MYVPEHFAVTSSGALHRIIRKHPLGMLVTHGDQGLEQTTSPSSSTLQGVLLAR